MITVPQAAQRTGRNPETIRRWIRAGRLRSERVGTQHLVDEAELEALVDDPADIVPPGGWGTLPSGAPAPNWAQAVRETRAGR
jgi:excisionase family DNA binding protein